MFRPLLPVGAGLFPKRKAGGLFEENARVESFS